MTSRLRAIPRRRWLAAYIVAAISVATLLTALPAPAQAATTVGQTGPIGIGGCTPSDNYGNLQSQTGAPPAYTIPFDGVITSFSAAAGEGGHPTKLLILRPVSGTTYNVAAKSATVNFTAAGVQTFPTQIAVQVGQLIGNYGYLCGLAASDPSDTFRYFNGPEPATGADQAYPSDTNPARINLSANLEPDCDNDGLGDETQDSDIASCAPAPPPPSGPAPGPAPGPPSGPAPGPGPAEAAATCRGLTATIVGTEGNDVRTGTPGRDVMLGLGGNDTLSGLAGNDVICGASGNDTLKGGKGKDTLLGQKGSDKLKGGGGNDKLSGKKGKDTLKGGGGKDNLKGGGGRDTCIGGKANDSASKCEVEKSI